MPILERQKVNEFVTNYASIGNIAALDQTGQTLKQLNQRFPIDKIMDWMGDAYDYDINGLKANSEKDKIKQENLEKLKKLQEALTINPPTNDQATPTPQQAPTQGMPMQQPSQVSG